MTTSPVLAVVLENCQKSMPYLPDCDFRDFMENAIVVCQTVDIT